MNAIKVTTVALAMILLSTVVAIAQPVYFADANLKAAVETTLGISNPTPSDMLLLERLVAWGRGISDLTGLEYATNLWDLYLGGNEISDLSPISLLSSLRLLNVYDNSISDVSVISGLTGLTELSLGANNISDISPIAGFYDLTYLDLYRNPLTDISVVGAFTHLRFLQLELVPFTDISPLWNLKELEDVTMLRYPDGADLSFFGTCYNMRSLALRGFSLSDISWISSLSQLEYLCLNSNDIYDLSPLSGLTNLLDLMLNWNEITDISPLYSLSNLRMLQLGSNPISDFSLISSFSNLEWLDLPDCGLSDLAFLESLTSLEYLILSYNQISDISVLSLLTSLRTLILSDNQISDISVLSLLPNLSRQVDLSRNNISDISPLSQHTSLRWLFLTDNPLSKDSYCTYLPLIIENNPTIAVYYDENPYDCGYGGEPTPVGEEVIVIPIDNSTGTTPVTVTFEEVTEAGETTLSTSASGPETPSGFQLGDPPIYQEINTTAETTGLIDICVSYANINFIGPPEELKLFHYEEGEWVDCTTMVDTENKLVYGVVSSLSPFAIMELSTISVEIDIKPGSYPNSINPKAGGVIPVAILTTEDFDASTVDPGTVKLEGANVQGKGKSGGYGSLEDIDGDGDLDLVVQIENSINWEPNATQATLTGNLKAEYGGNPIEGSDSVNIVPPK